MTVFTEIQDPPIIIGHFWWTCLQCL